MTKIIFLDIDGPLVNDRTSNIGKKQYGIQGQFDPVGIRMLNQLAEDFKAEFVFSTTWRTAYGDYLPHVMNVAGLNTSNIYGLVGYRGSRDDPPYFTPHGKSRHHEIAEWIEAYNPDNFVIIDDLVIKHPYKGNWIEADPVNGLSYQDYIKARSILGMDKWQPSNKNKDLGGRALGLLSDDTSV